MFLNQFYGGMDEPELKIIDASERLRQPSREGTRLTLALRQISRIERIFSPHDRHVAVLAMMSSSPSVSAQIPVHRR